MKNEILPFVGVGPLRFGDKEGDVRGKLGEPIVEAVVQQWGARRLDYNCPKLSCYFSDEKGLFLVSVPADGVDLVLFGEDVFTSKVFEAIKGKRVIVEFNNFSSSFGEETLYRAPQIGMVFACEVFDTKPQAVFCYEKSAWEEYEKNAGNET